MKRTLLFAIALVALHLTQAMAQAAPGYHTTKLTVAHRSQPLPLHIWYPGKGDGVLGQLGKNVVFTGIDVEIDATPIERKSPLVVLSHGSGGNAINIGWIAAHLAEQGMIVVSTNHPGSTSRDSLPRETLKTWQRADDFSAILDFLGDTPPMGLQIDMDRVGSVGFSLGGYTVLGLAGGRLSKQKYIDYCAEHSEILDCVWFSAGGIDLGKIDADKFQQSNQDQRIGATVAIDPAFAQAFTSHSLKQILSNVMIINLGSKGSVPVAIEGSKILAKLPNADYARVNGATHFSFLGECTAIGETIIKEEGDEPICSEVSDRKRSDIHDELKGLISGFLKKQL